MIVGVDPKIDYAFKRLFGREQNVALLIHLHSELLDPEQLPAELQEQEIQHALGELHQMTQSELERERYEMRVKAQRDVQTALAEARQEGRVDELTRQLHFCERLLAHPATPLDQARELDLTELERRVRQLEAEIMAKSSPGPTQT